MIDEREQMPATHLPFGDRQDAPFYNRDIVSVRQFTDADLEAIFSYLQSIPAIRNRVPEPLPPSAEVVR